MSVKSVATLLYFSPPPPPNNVEVARREPVFVVWAQHWIRGEVVVLGNLFRPGKSERE